MIPLRLTLSKSVLKLVAVACLGAAMFIPGHAARAAGTITCPTAPSGWTAAAENPIIWGPAQNPGQDSEEVTCTYSKSGKVASLISEFALPVDPNPFSDFNYGCSNPLTTAWTPTARVYITSSKSIWGYTEFVDTNHQIADGDVGSFETAAKALLKGSEPYGHTCKLTTTETSVLSSFYFSFEYAELGKNFTLFGGVDSSIPGNPEVPAGSFSTKTTAAGSSTLEDITSVHVPLIPITVVQNGHKYTVVLKLTKGVDFYLKTPVQRLRADLEVVRSNLAACKKGSHGTIALTTQQAFARAVGPSKISIKLCGDLFRTGKQVARGEIING